MKKIVAIIILTFLFGTPVAFAKTVTIAGSVTNQSAIPGGSRIVFTDTASKQIITTTVNPNGTYNMSLPEGIYDVAIISPPNSGLLEVKEYHQKFTADTINNILAPASVNKENSIAKERPYIIGGVIIGILGLAIGYLLLRK